MNMIPTLESAAVTLRPFHADDAPVVQQLAGAYEVADTTLHIPHPYEDGMAEAWIAQHATNFAARRVVTFAIVRSDAVVGAISLMNIEPDHQLELGYWVGVPFWGNGLCTAAGRLAVDYAFDTVAVRRVYAHHLSRNPASGRVLQKLGFRHEGTRRQHVRKWGHLEDVEDYGLLADER